MLIIRDSAHHVVDRIDIVSTGGTAGLFLTKSVDGNVGISWGQEFRGTLT
jgi:hypothetical protein